MPLSNVLRSIEADVEEMFECYLIDFIKMVYKPNSSDVDIECQVGHLLKIISLLRHNTTLMSHL